MRNLLRQKKESIKASTLNQEKETDAIKGRIIRHIWNLFELENKWENYHKPIRVGNFYSNDDIGYDSNGDTNKTLPISKYLKKIRPYLQDIKVNLKKPDTWKIQLAIVINFMSSKDIDEECLIHSKSDNIEIMTNDKAEEVNDHFL